MSRRLRLILLVLGGFALALVLAAVIAVYLLLQPERFTRMLQTQARTAGLELNLASPASPTLFPRPALDLDGITLNARGRQRADPAGRARPAGTALAHPLRWPHRDLATADRIAAGRSGRAAGVARRPARAARGHAAQHSAHRHRRQHQPRQRGARQSGAARQRLARSRQPDLRPAVSAQPVRHHRGGHAAATAAVRHAAHRRQRAAAGQHHAAPGAGRRR